MTKDAHDKARILIVDDVASKLLSLRAILEELDEIVVPASSGAEALRRLLEDDFAVILLDVNMPDMDGFETAALIRQRKRSEHTPIIFLTAYPDETHAGRGYSLGAVDYILTPVMPEVLRTKVRVFVDLYHMTQQAQRQAEERIALAQEQAARAAAEKANQAKNQFLANVSHELRTPMNAIMGMTELALNERLSPLVREYLETVQSSAKSLLDLLNEILDFSKLESGKFALQSVPFNLRELVDGICRMYDLPLAEKGLALCMEVDDDVPEALIGDPRRLGQVLQNLLSNAVKFTDRGSVAVNVRRERSSPWETSVRFSVADTGIGIPPADQAGIFAPFTQVDSTNTRRQSGTGLGLAIASDLVQAMGGRIAVNSALGEGSEFTFVVPLAPARDDAPETDIGSESHAASKRQFLADVPPVDSMRILLAEDVRANQYLVVRALEKRGHRVDLASNGREVLGLAAKARYDVILMDIQMPDMDGFQATEAVRGIEHCSHVPIIALTAHAMAGDRQRCLAAGMDDYLAKPLDLVRLVQTVEAYAPQAITDDV